MSLMVPDNQSDRRRPWLNRARRGIAALEFALTLPIWIILIMGLADGTYFLLKHEKADRIAFTVADVTSQYPDPLSLLTMADIFQAAQQIWKPFTDFNSSGYVIVSSINKLTALSPPVITWQVCSIVGGIGIGPCPSGLLSSRIGHALSTVTPAEINNLSMGAGDNIIVAEVTYQFVPIFVNIYDVFNSSVIYHVAMFQPRGGALITPPT